MGRKKRYRNILIIILCFSLAGLGVFHYNEEKSRIPDSYLQTTGEEIPQYSSLWVSEEIVPGAAEASSAAFAKDTYFISYRYLGIVPLKEAKVEVQQPLYVTPGGIPVGIYAETAGILVIGTGKVESADGLVCEPAYQLVQAGDYIQAVDGQPISEKEELIKAIQESKEAEVILDVYRDGEEIRVRIEPVSTKEGDKKLGIWVRDNTQGVGTLTFLTEDGHFGALGHGISDVDTGELLQISEGRLYDTRIVDIKKGEKGTPGEVSGLIRYRKDLECGDLLKNTNVGIFGEAAQRLYEKIPGETMQIGYKQEIELGQAWVRSSISGSIRDYQVEILEVNCKDSDLNKGIVFQVTDPELLELSGGIVQGQSGSPIIQNGKLIGAVTHVFVQDPTKGFGVFIENMLVAEQ